VTEHFSFSYTGLETLALGAALHDQDPNIDFTLYLAT
jgi:hypothetical protein